MNYLLSNDLGTMEAVIDDNCGINKFYSIAHTLSNDLKINFLEKHKEFDSVQWNFKFKGHRLKLLYNIYQGVSISAACTKDNEVIIELASLLKRKLF